MSKFNSFISLKEAFAGQLVSDWEIYLQEEELKAEANRLKREQFTKRLNSLFARVLARVQYYGLDYTVEYSTRSESVYIKVKGKQIRISGHDVAPGNFKSDLQFLTYESPISISIKLVKLLDYV